MNVEREFRAEAHKAVEALKGNRFQARYFPTSQEAVTELLAAIPRGRRRWGSAGRGR